MRKMSECGNAHNIYCYDVFMLSEVVPSAVKGSVVITPEGVTSLAGAPLTPSKDTPLISDISGAKINESDGR